MPLPVRTAHAHDCLECYQCDSSTNESFPFCDDYYWHTLSKAKKSTLIVGCVEPYLFCIKKETIVSGKKTTQRGCVKDVDSQGHEVIEGCIRGTNESTQTKVTLCFCQKLLCNSANKHSLAQFSLIFMFLSHFVWIFFKF